MLVSRAIALVFAALASVAARGQLHIGNANFLGVHTDFQRRPIYGYLGVAGSFGSRNAWNAAPALGLGHAWRLSPRLYVAAEGVYRVELRSSNDRGGGIADDVGHVGTLGASVFVSTSKHNRDFLKVGLPILRSRRSFAPASLGLVSFFGRRGEYLAPERTRGPIEDAAVRPYAEGRYGMHYAAQAVSVRAGLEAGVFDVGLGAVFGRRGSFRTFDEHFLDNADAVVTGSMGLLVRRREAARTWIAVEAAFPFGDGKQAAGDLGQMGLSGGIYVRHQQNLPGSRFSVGIEGGLDVSQRSFGPETVDNVAGDLNISARLNAGLRYRLTP